MTKTRVVLCCAASVLAGAAVGAGLTLSLGGRMVNASVMARAEADLVVSSSLLEQIESGDLRKAADLLNAQLDGALVTIDAYNSQGVTPKPAIYSRLDRIKTMRRESSYVPSDPQVAESVTRALNLGSMQ